MDHDKTTEERLSPNRDTKQKNAKNWLTWLVIALLVLSLVGNGYLWMQLQSSKKNERELRKHNQLMEKQLEDLTKDLKAAKSAAPVTSTHTACTHTPTVAFKDNIKAALDTKNTAAFATYTTDPVKYVLAASEYGGNISATEAATSLEYTHSATGPWNFALPAATISTYDSSFYTDYFDANTLVGKASSGMVVAFEFNCDGTKISEIFVASDDDLLMP